MRSSSSIIIIGTIFLTSAAPSSAATKEEEVAKCFWEKAPKDAEMVASAPDQMTFIQGLVNGGTACGHDKLTVDIEKFRVAVRNARPAANQVGQKN